MSQHPLIELANDREVRQSKGFREAAARITGTVVNTAARPPAANGPDIRIGHPSGVLPVDASVTCDEGQWQVEHVVAYRTARRLMERKVRNITSTEAQIVTTANPGCHLQLEAGLDGSEVEVAQPVVLLAEAYKAETRG